MARIAREYGWDPRVFPLLMATGLTKEDCDIIAASICQGRRLFAEEVMRSVWPDAPAFDSNALMAYNALRQPASERPNAIDPDKIRIAALEQEIKERDLHIADLEASLAQCHKTIDSVMEMLSHNVQPTFNEERLPMADSEVQEPISEAEADFAVIVPNAERRHGLMERFANSADADAAIKFVVGSMVEEGIISEDYARSEKFLRTIQGLMHHSTGDSISNLKDKAQRYFGTPHPRK